EQLGEGGRVGQVLLAAAGDGAFELAEIETGAERVASSSQHHDSDARVGVGLRQRRSQFVAQLLGERVADLRTVEGNHPHLAVVADLDTAHEPFYEGSELTCLPRAVRYSPVSTARVEAVRWRRQCGPPVRAANAGRQRGRVPRRSRVSIK